MSIVEILDVSLTKQDFSYLCGYAIDAPKPGSQSESYAIEIGGWVLGQQAPVVAVEVIHDGRELRTIPIGVSRPGVAIRFPTVRGAENCGFRAAVGVLGTPSEFELLLRAVLEDGGRIPLGVIRGRHQSLNSGFQPKLQPVMITSLGRTGTTWLMRLLAEHPGIVGYRRYPYEVRSARYWMHMLRVLSEPANYHQSSQVNSFHRDMHWVGQHPFYLRPVIHHSEVYKWLGRTYLEQLAAFCQGSIEAFYQAVASSQGQTEPVYFIEKHSPDHIQWLMWELYPQAREVILVRDFRDMVCSILSFNVKRGYTGFGRERVGSDEEYVQQQRFSALRLLESWKSRSKQAHLLRYEDLVLRPVESLKALLEYFDLECSPSTIQGMLLRALEETPEMDRHRTSQEPRRSIGRWQHDLDSSLQSVCREAFGDILQEFGYKDDF